MPNESPIRKRQTAKIAVIPLLLLILWKVVAANATDDDMATSQPATPPPSNATADSSARRVENVASPPRQRNWPDWSLAEVVRHNPFTFTGRRDPLTSVAAVVESNAEPEKLEVIEAKLTAYLLSKNGEVALIEGQVVRVGDVVDDQWIVTELGPGGATLAPLAAPSDDR